MNRRPRPLRADAARNRERLLAAASEVFARRGLDAPLDEIARRSGVSIGTLYNHFPTREDLWDAIFPARLAVLDAAVDAALADPDPWAGFVAYAEALFALHATDRGLNDVLAQRGRASPRVAEACHRCLGHIDRLITRARGSGQLRGDFGTSDFAALMWALSQVIRETAEVAPQAWRRHLAFHLDGLRADAAHALPAPALSMDQIDLIMTDPPH